MLSASNSPYELEKTERVETPVGGATKRAFDLTTGILILVIIAPVLAAIAAAIYLSGSGRVLFRHRRVGFGGREFSCYKFRSMIENSETVLQAHLRDNAAAAAEWARDQKLKNDPRITPMGRILRSSSLDELPQVFNVIKGEMSLVGPRPIVASEAERFGPEFERYKTARPGITGLWQVSGRSNCSYAERIQHDANYVKEWSMARDLMIIGKTTKVVLSRRGSF